MTTRRRDLDLYFREARMGRRRGLDGLDPAPPVTAEPQRNASLPQGAFRRVEIDTSHEACFRGCTRQLQRRDTRAKSSRSRLVDDEFQLDLAHVTDTRRPSARDLTLFGNFPQAHAQCVMRRLLFWSHILSYALFGICEGAVSRYPYPGSASS